MEETLDLSFDRLLMMMNINRFQTYLVILTDNINRCETHLVILTGNINRCETFGDSDR